MDSFRTELPIIKSSIEINHQKSIFSSGSCFAEHIGERLKINKFSTLINPFGIVYNPYSLFEGIDRLLNNKIFESNEVLQYEDKWLSFMHHGRFSGHDRDVTIQQINDSFDKGQKHLHTADIIIITLGSAFVYEYIETRQIVANCHKIPAKAFKKRLLLVEEIVGKADEVFMDLFNTKPNAEIIISVSPVRHIRDGIIENQRSKATLILAAHEICEKWKQVHYFPAYELLLDDLRDYRFYADDMVHPSAKAVDYIWEYFVKAYFGEEPREVLEILDKIRRAAAHRPFAPKSNKHQNFLTKQLELIDRVVKERPYLNLEREKEMFQNQMGSI